MWPRPKCPTHTLQFPKVSCHGRWILWRPKRSWFFPFVFCSHFQYARRFLGMIGRDPNVSKSNRLHVDIFQFSLYWFEIYFIEPSKMMGKMMALEANHCTCPNPMTTWSRRPMYKLPLIPYLIPKVLPL